MPKQESSGTLDALIVGAGFAGLYQLHHLREMGFSVRLFDAGADLGGTWHWNRYPGARVDTHIPNYEFTFGEIWKDWRWSEKFPGWEEIRRYFQYVDDKLDLRRDIQFNTRVTDATFDAQRDSWQIQSDDGVQTEARFFLLCTGFAAKAHIPSVLDPSDFNGECYHTAHWPEEEVSFSGKAVGVIGTGASGLQVIQEAAGEADSLTVFQRTPNLALPMRQRTIEESDHAVLQEILADLNRRRRDEYCNIHDIQPAGPVASEFSAEQREAVFEQAWRSGGFHFWGGTFQDVVLDPESNRQAYDFWRAKTKARIDDPVVAEILAPREPIHPFGTVRPSLEQHYFEVYNQANVSLVNTRAEPIQRITEQGVVTSDGEYALDLLVLATGFDALTGGLMQINITGTSGETLAEKWRDGVKNYLGMTIAGFPNMFFVYGPLSPAALCTGPVCAELQGAWITDCIAYMRDKDLRRIEASTSAENAWVKRVADIGETTLFPRANSWYMGANVDGKPRQFLCYYELIDYMEQCRKAEATDYTGFHIG